MSSGGDGDPVYILQRDADAARMDARARAQNVVSWCFALSLLAGCVACGARTVFPRHDASTDARPGPDASGDSSRDGDATPLPCVSTDGPPLRAARLALGGGHTCTLSEDDRVYCWGANSFGQVGDGTTTDRWFPVVVPLAGITDIQGGDDHTCALTSSGDVYCWGWNVAGQLGVGDSANRRVPTRVPLGRPAMQIAVGGWHTCAIDVGGGVFCWGENDFGQIGNGRMTTQLPTGMPHPGELLPTAVIGLPAVVRLHAGNYHTCAVTADHVLWCWGGNVRHQLGDGSTTQARATPERIAEGVTDVALGGEHSCSIGTDASVACWGANEWGQLALGDFRDRSVPTTVPALLSPLALTTHGPETCQLRADGTALCAGYNHLAQLGRDAPIEVPSPLPLALPDRALAIEVGYHSCAILTDHSLWCWGYDGRGQLGDCRAGRGQAEPVRVNLHD